MREITQEQARELLAAAIELIEREKSLPFNIMDVRAAAFLDARDALKKAIAKAEGGWRRP